MDAVKKLKKLTCGVNLFDDPKLLRLSGNLSLTSFEVGGKSLVES